MIALAEKPRRKKQTKPSAPAFELLLPLIEKQARIAFCPFRRSEREELIAEVVANCYVAYVRLVERGLGHAIYATPLAQFAVRQVRAGRKTGDGDESQNVRVREPCCVVSRFAIKTNSINSEHRWPLRAVTGVLFF